MDILSINPYVLYGVVSKVVAILLVAIWVIPKQKNEIEKKNEFRKLGVILMMMSMVFVLILPLPIFYNLSQIYRPSEFNFQNVTSLMSNTAILMYAFGWFVVYNYNFERRGKNGGLPASPNPTTSRHR